MIQFLLASLAGPALAAPEDVSGTIALDPTVAATVKPGDTIFLYARPPGVTAGPPTWVERLKADSFPMAFTIGPANAMMGGATPPQVALTARIDRDGNPTTHGPDDLEARSDALTPGATGVTLTLAPPAASAAAPPASATSAPSPDAAAAPATPGNAPAQAEGVDPSKLIGAPAGPPLTGDELHRRTHEIAKLLRCPVCQGETVADSPSTAAVAMKKEVEDLVAKGYDKDQILFYFEASYGQFILLEPRKEGVNLLVWGAPGAMLLAGTLWVAFAVNRRRRAAPAPGSAAPAEDPALAPYLARVREETRR